VGGAALVTGVILLAIGESDISNATTLCGPLTPKKECSGNADAANNAQSTGNTLAAVGGIVGGVGVLAVAGGLIWHFVEPTGPDTTAAKTGKVELRPDARPGYGGLTIVGSF